MTPSEIIDAWMERTRMDLQVIIRDLDSGVERQEIAARCKRMLAHADRISGKPNLYDSAATHGGLSGGMP